MTADHRPITTFGIRPREFTSLQILNQIEKTQRQTENLRGMLLQPQPEITVNIDASQPVRIIEVSDTHLFTALTNYDSVRKLFKKFEDPYTLMVVCGDFLEFANPGIGSHIGEVMLSGGDQMRLGKKFLRQYAESGQLLGMVAVFNGHEGWAEKNATINAVVNMADDLYHPDGSPVQTLINGGDIVIKLPNKKIFRFSEFHNAGVGGSDDINPLGSERYQGWKRPLNSDDRADAVVGGHMHHRAAVSKERVLNKLNGKTETIVYMALGTHKSIERKKPDGFINAMGKEENKKPGAGIVLNFSNSEHSSWTTFGYDKLGHMYRAAKLWDKAERSGITEELHQKVMDRNPKPEIKFERSKSRAQTNEDDEVKVPLFELARWKSSNGELPVAVYFLGNARYGSTSGERDREKFKAVVNIVSKNNLACLVGMRHLIDNGVGSLLDRKGVLSEMADDLRPAYDSNSLLGIVLSSSLRNNAWKRDLKDDGKVYPGFLPGNLLYKKLLPKTPLLLNESILTFAMNGFEYNMLLMDRLQGSGSFFDPFRGLVQSHRKTQLGLDVVAGGHMMGSGFMQTEKTVYIAPGWFSDFDSGGKGNQKRVTEGGQAVILLPKDKGVIPASSLTEAVDIHTALTLKFGLTDKEKASLMRRKVR